MNNQDNDLGDLRIDLGNLGPNKGYGGTGSQAANVKPLFSHHFISLQYFYFNLI